MMNVRKGAVIRLVLAVYSLTALVLFPAPCSSDELDASLREII